MTREEYDEVIQLNIKDKNSGDKMTEANQGAALDAAAEYAESVAITKVRKTRITYAQLLTLFDSPIVLVPGETGKIKLPIQMLWRFNDNAGWGNSGTPWNFKNGDVSMAGFTSQIGGASINEQFFTFGTLGTVATTLEDADFTIKASSNLSGAGDTSTTVDIWVVYTEITL